MPETRELTREELLNNLNEAHDYITKLEAENRAMAESIDKYYRTAELRYKDGMIAGLKFAIRFYMAGDSR